MRHHVHTHANLESKFRTYPVCRKRGMKVCAVYSTQFISWHHDWVDVALLALESAVGIHQVCCIYNPVRRRCRCMKSERTRTQEGRKLEKRAFADSERDKCAFTGAGRTRKEPTPGDCNTNFASSCLEAASHNHLPNCFSKPFETSLQHRHHGHYC